VFESNFIKTVCCLLGAQNTAFGTVPDASRSGQQAMYRPPAAQHPQAQGYIQPGMFDGLVNSVGVSLTLGCNVDILSQVDLNCD